MGLWSFRVLNKGSVNRATTQPASSGFIQTASEVQLVRRGTWRGARLKLLVSLANLKPPYLSDMCLCEVLLCLSLESRPPCLAF